MCYIDKLDLIWIETLFLHSLTYTFALKYAHQYMQHDLTSLRTVCAVFAFSRIALAVLFSFHLFLFNFLTIFHAVLELLLNLNSPSRKQ